MVKKIEIVRVESNINDIDPLQWLTSQSNLVRTYWSSRDEIFEMAGIGEAYVVRGDLALCGSHMDDLCLLSSDDERIRFYGGSRFDALSRPGEDWENFGGFRFVLPAVEIVRRASGCFLAQNFIELPSPLEGEGLRVRGRRADYSDQIFLRPPPNPCAQGGRENLFREIANVPCFAEWQKSVDQLEILRAQKKVEKVVLARKRSFESTRNIDGFELLQRAKKLNSKSFGFCFQNASGDYYLGLSPELLYHRKDKQIEVESLAGTKPRGINEMHDRQLEDELKSSPKEVYEHEFVNVHVRTVLKENCEGFYESDFRGVKKLRYVQHLHTKFFGKLKEMVSDAKLLSALNPTPAVCGSPKSRALEIIAQHEPFDRGCYSGPVGYLSAKESLFSVGIRSALIRKNRIHLFAGAGIVDGSDAMEEWREIDNKMRLYTELLCQT